ncbi:hypothetical protein C2845_PM11G06690 [Panicum miliaceum]|uniref:Uncharacterized protein n=1 Tax=Panicum miliaceum TaxID=4540 RepID=A0A3L6RNX6_PANMI|nr:hypothetical protein C2845_PM11G06690 [Panicum miliaceum]
MAPRLVGALLLVLAVRGEADAPRLRGPRLRRLPRLRRGARPLRYRNAQCLTAGRLPSEARQTVTCACVFCIAPYVVPGVVVAVRCAGGPGGAGLLRAAQTDSRGAFDVAMPATAPTPCAARVLGATEQLCAPRGLAVARVVPGGAASPSSYALGSPLAFFTTRCRPASGGSAAATTMDAPDRQRQRDAPRVPPAARPAPPAMQAPVGAPPRAGGDGSSPFGVGGGLPLIFFFPFIPIIGIP